MKKNKLLIILVISLLCVTGCFKRDSMDNINILTTTYPINYLVEEMYGYNSDIDSIYPNSVDIKSYELTEKQLKEYSKNSIFIYNGLSKEKNIAAKFLNYNSQLKLIDVTKGITIQRDEEELWLSPSNYLMLAQNIKTSLQEYTTSTIIKQEIEDKYEDIKLTISKYDAELNLIAENATNKTIIAGNDVFKFLEKYGFKVLSVEDNDLFVSSEFTEAKSAVASQQIKTIFVLENDPETENVNKLVAAGATIVKINPMTNLTDEQASNGIDYQQMIESFIEKLKNEVYN